MPTVIRVLSCAGRAVNNRILATFPDSEVVRIRRDDPLPEDVSGDVLIATYGAADVVGQLARRVKWVHVMGTGIDWLPPDAFEAETLTCARGGSGIAISEFVLAAMLCLEKQLPELWGRPPDLVFSRADLGGLSGRHLGLVGLGGIGTQVATRAQAFGMRVSAVRRHPGPSPVPGVETAPLGWVLSHADHLVLAAPDTPETHHLIGESTVDQLKPGVHIVNIARGGLIDQEVLRRALEAGRVARATLDVSDPEPLPEGHWMYSHPQVRLTGHISWSSPQGLEPLIGVLLDNLARYQQGRPLTGVVDPAERY
jgi:phosphoglycerate dehydrogenase-like enzyme